MENLHFVVNNYNRITQAITDKKIVEIFTSRELEFNCGYNVNSAYNDFIRLVKMGVIIQTEGTGKLIGKLIDKESIRKLIYQVAKSYRIESKKYEGMSFLCEKIGKDF